MTDKFRSDYLMEADEYIPDEEKSQTPTEDQTDDEFGVDQYDGSEMTADEPSADDGEIATTYGDDEMMDPDDVEDVDVSIISNIYSLISDFFPRQTFDGQKIKDWIESTMETENLTTESEFLNFFADDVELVNSYKSFGGDEDAVEAEKEATEPEEESEKDEDETSEESESESDEAEGDDEKEPVTESKKKSKLTRKKRLSENSSNIWWTSSSGRLEIEFDMPREDAIEIIDDCSAGGRDADPYVTEYINNPRIKFHINPMSKIPARQIMIDELKETGAWDVDELNNLNDGELKKKILWIACNDLEETENFNQFGDEDLTESKKPKLTRKKRLSESKGFEIGDLVCSKPDGYSDFDRQRAGLVVGKTVDDDGVVIYEVLKRYRNGDVETEYESDLVNFYYCSDDSNNYHDLSAYKNIAKRESLKLNVPVDRCSNEDGEDLTESKKKPKLVKEAYSEDLSRELQMLISIKNSTSDKDVIRMVDDVILKIKEKLKEPTQDAVRTKPQVTESVRDRIRAKLRANRK